MAETKQVLTRIKLLDELLSDQYHDYNMDDIVDHINDRLEDMGYESVTRRAIEKDIKYLQEKSPFEVFLRKYKVTAYNGEKDRHCVKYCLKYEDPGFSIFKKEMSDDEKYLLSEALKLVGQFEGLPNFEELESLRLSLGLQKNDRQIVSFTKNPQEDSSLFGQLFTAISQKQVIELQYHKFESPQDILVVNLHPYLLKEYNRRWYLFAAAENDGKLLCFGMERINGFTPLPAHTYVEYEGNINEIFEDIIGVTYYLDCPTYKIYFWVSDHSMDYVATKALHDSQRNVSGTKEAEFRARYPQLEGGRFFRIDCKYNYELIRELSSFGKDLLVLEPGEIQDKVFERVASMFEDYSKVRT